MDYNPYKTPTAPPERSDPSSYKPALRAIGWVIMAFIVLVVPLIAGFLYFWLPRNVVESVFRLQRSELLL